MSKRKNRDPWSWSRGPKGSRVTVEERGGYGDIVRLRWGWNGTSYQTESLGFEVRDEDGKLDREAVDEAIDRCNEKYREVREGHGDEPVETDDLTLRDLLNLYDRRVTKRKVQLGDATEETRRRQQRRGKAWSNFLDPDRRGVLANKVKQDDIRAFAAARLAGEIGPEGHPQENGHEVGPTTVARDVPFLRQVYTWAQGERGTDGGPLVPFNPTDNVALPRERNPKQVTATREIYRKLREEAAKEPEGPSWSKLRPYLPRVLDLLAHTGRRVDAVCSLRYEHLRFGPDGGPRAILWPADTDKMERESPLSVPLPQEARETIEAILEDRGPSTSDYLFPCPCDPSESVDYNSLYRFLWDAGNRAENLTLPDGFGFHSFRRMVVTELLEEGWSPKHVGQYVGMSPKMVLEVYGKPTEGSLEQMADSLS